MASTKDKIRIDAWGNKTLRINGNTSYFYRCPINKNELKREGRSLTIKRLHSSITLTGTEINSIKKILEATE